MVATADTPRLRLDLLAEPVEDNGVHFVDVMDDARCVTYRFYDAEFALACALDGERDIDAVVRWAEAELGFRPRATEVRAVIDTLESLGYLDGAAVEVASSAGVAPAEASVELAPGIVAGDAAATAAAVDHVELGHVEPSAPGASAELPASTELELGGAGSTAEVPRGNVVVEDVPLGPPGAGAAASASDVLPGEPSEVSLALTDHVAVDVSDVKEAVRQSEIMRAVPVEEAADAISTTPVREPSALPAPVEPAPAVRETEPAGVTTAPTSATAEPPEQRRAAPEPPQRASRAPVRWVVGGLALAASIVAVVLFVIPDRDKPSAQREAEPAVGNTPGSANEDRIGEPAAPIVAPAADDHARTDAAADQAAADKAAAAKAAADQAAADQAAADKAAADKAAADQAAADQAAADKAAADQAAADQAAADKAAAEQAADRAAAAREAARRAARAKARAEAAAREQAKLEKLLQKQREALEARRRKAAGSGSATTPAPSPSPPPSPSP